jgi:hypothetical protein
MKKILNITFVIYICCFLLGCSDEYKQSEVEKNFLVNKSALEMYVGDTQQLTASPTNVSFEWEIEDPSIAKVSVTGLVEAVSAGVTNIVVSRGDLHKTIPVTVTIPAVDKVIARAGKERLLIELQINSDRIKNVRLTRADTNESTDIAINYQSGIFEHSLNNLPEATYTFTVVSFDRFDNPSEPIEIKTKTLGNIYQSQLRNRTGSATLLGNGLVMALEPTLQDALSCEMSYTNKNGETVTTNIPMSQTSVYLYDYSPASGIEYITLFGPEACIDTFYTTTANMAVNNKLPVLSNAAPCAIGAADFDLGGEGIGFHDFINSGVSASQVYRKSLGDNLSLVVDIEDGCIAWTGNNEWLAYTVDVKTAGNYNADVEVAINRNCKFYLIVDDDVQTASCSMTSWGGSWTGYKWYFESYPSATQPVVNLTAGTHQIKYVFEAAEHNLRGLKFTYKE